MAQRGTMIGMKSIIILFICHLHESHSRTYEIIVPGVPYTRPLAQAACQSQYGTDLATIVSEADATEALRVANTISASFFIWIGLNDLDTEGTYVFEECQSQYGTDLATIVSEADATEASEQHAMISVLKYGKQVNQMITMLWKTVHTFAYEMWTKFTTTTWSMMSVVQRMQMQQCVMRK
eukprot:595789_1